MLLECNCINYEITTLFLNVLTSIMGGVIAIYYCDRLGIGKCECQCYHHIDDDADISESSEEDMEQSDRDDAMSKKSKESDEESDGEISKLAILRIMRKDQMERLMMRFANRFKTDIPLSHIPDSILDDVNALYTDENIDRVVELITSFIDNTQSDKNTNLKSSTFIPAYDS